MWLAGGAVAAERNEPQPPGSPQPPHALIQKLGFDYVGGRPHESDRSTRVNPISTPPSVSSTRSAEVFSYDGAAWAILADRRSTGGSYCMFEVVMAQGRAETPHFHDDTDEVIFVLDGEIEISLNAKRERVAADTLVFVPRGTVHSYRALSPLVRILDIYTDPGFDRLLTRLGASTDTFAPPVQQAGRSPMEEQRLTFLFDEIGLHETAAASTPGVG